MHLRMGNEIEDVARGMVLTVSLVLCMIKIAQPRLQSTGAENLKKVFKKFAKRG